MTQEYTAHYRLPIPDFNAVPWHQAWEDSLRAVDEALYLSTIADAPMWTNSTAFFIGDLVIDPQQGTLWVCKVAHTSPPSPTTFAADRLAQPTRWQGISVLPTFRGVWAPATQYNINDFVVNGSQYAVATVAHISSANFATDEAAGKWTVLIDTGATGVAINDLPPASVAAAATINLGATPSSRITITGVIGNITSFGNTPNTFKLLTMGSNGNTIVNGAGIQLPDSANIVAKANDIYYFVSNNSGLYILWGRLRKLDASDFDDVKQPATTTYQGVVELATDAEAVAKADTTRTITPSNLAALDASQTVKGLVELATDGEMLAKIDGTRAITPLNLAALNATQTQRGLVELATPGEALALTDPDRAVTPLALNSVVASTGGKGLTEYATVAEVQGLFINTKAVTPAGLAGLIGTTAAPGLVEFATSPETIALTLLDKAVSPGTLANVLASITGPGLVELADSAETLGLALGSRAVTPDGLGTLVATTTQRGIARFATVAEAQGKSATTVALTPNNLDDVTATRPEVQTETTNKFITPALAKYLPGAIKGFSTCEGTGVLQMGYNTSLAIDSGVGVSQVAHDEDMSNSVYAVVAAVYHATLDENAVVCETVPTAYTIRCFSQAGALVDPTKYFAVVLGTRTP